MSKNKMYLGVKIKRIFIPYNTFLFRLKWLHNTRLPALQKIFWLCTYKSSRSFEWCACHKKKRYFGWKKKKEFWPHIHDIDGQCLYCHKNVIQYFTSLKKNNISFFFFFALTLGFDVKGEKITNAIWIKRLNDRLLLEHHDRQEVHRKVIHAHTLPYTRTHAPSPCCCFLLEKVISKNKKNGYWLCGSKNIIQKKIWRQGVYKSSPSENLSYRRQLVKVAPAL